jgi:hypothetical protein
LNEGDVSHQSQWKRMHRTTGMKQCGQGKFYNFRSSKHGHNTY